MLKLKLGMLAVPSAYLLLSEGNAMCDNPAAPGSPSPKPEYRTETEKAEAELQSILAENPYAATDPEEMERILQTKNKNKNKKPPQFAKLILPIKMLTTCENLDGLRFEVAGGVSERLQLGAAWNFSNTKPSNFSLSAMFAPNMNPYSDEGMNFIN